MNAVTRASRFADVYIGAVVALGALVLLAALRTVDIAKVDVPTALLLLALTAIAQRNPVFLIRSSSISVAFGVQIAAFVLYGPGIAVLASLVQAGVNAMTPERKPLRKVLFNAAAFTISTTAASVMYGLAGGATPPGDVVPTVLAVAIATGAYFAVSSILVAGVIALVSDDRVDLVWRQNFSWLPLNYLATGVNGAALALAGQTLGLFGIAVFVLPLVVAWYSFKLYMAKSLEVRQRNEELHAVNEVLARANAELQESNRSVVGALVGALEAKNGLSRAQLDSVVHAAATARKLGLAEDEIGAVRLGALLHDVGKIGVREDVLTKADALTEEEWAQLRAHPAIGAGILARVPALAAVRPLVLAHHERYDGTGYPNGLKGDAIPLGAQIIAVCDAFEAMVAARPYRPALSPKQALRELRAASGTQFNPIVVEAFIAEVTRHRRSSRREAGGERQGQLRQAEAPA